MSSSAAGIPPVIFLLVALAIAGALSFLGCRALLRSRRFQTMPRAVGCSLLWTLPAALLSLPWLSITRHPTEVIGLWLFIPVAALVGLAFGGVFWLLARKGVTGHWPQRTLVGALLGLVLAVLCGALLHHFLTGWGGPGSGAFRRSSVMNASVLFSWLVPLLAVMGIATPLEALMPAPLAEKA